MASRGPGHAEQLSEDTGGRVLFTLARTDAHENVVKITPLASSLPQGAIVVLERLSHGATFTGMALSGHTRTQDFVDAAALGVHHVEPPHDHRCPFGTDAP